MVSLNFGDLAVAYQMRRDNVRLRTDMMRLTAELSSGHKADVSTTVSGDFGPITALEHQLRQLDAYDTASTEAGMFTSAAQQALGRIHDISIARMPILLDIGTKGSMIAVGGVTKQASQDFAAAISALNMQAGGRSIFAGTATASAALKPADDILADLRAVIATKTTGADVAQAVSDWFAPGNGFDTTAYIGSVQSLAPFKVADGTSVQMDLTAANPALRDTLSGLAMAALVEGGPLAGNNKESASLLGFAGKALLSGGDKLVAFRAELGTVEAAIEKAETQNGAERTALGMARNKLTAIDPFQVATELTALEVQIETLYTMTARLSRLKLTDFLR